MKLLFAVLLAILVVMSFITWWTQPSQTTDVPTLYWVTDNNPARREQVRKFHYWLVHNECETDEKGLCIKHKKNGGYTRKWLLENENLKGLTGFDRTPKDNDDMVPCLQLKTDFASSSGQKRIIQGVSGIGGDIMDIHSSGGQQVFFDQIGLLEDVTQQAKQYGYTPRENSWPSLYETLTVEDIELGKRKQVAFPCNVTIGALWVNRKTFKDLGLPVPPRRWTFEEFEKMGKEFVKRANEGKSEADRVFFCKRIEVGELVRSMGRSLWNETLTLPTLDSPEVVKALTLMSKWMNEDRLFPTDAEIKAAQTPGAYAGPMMELFNKGRLGVLGIGRYGLIQFRKYDPPMDLKIIEHPHGGFPCTAIGTRMAAVYSGGKYKPLAVLFQAFLASQPYNDQVVEDADALPPNPKMARGEAFDHPPRFKNEWTVHAPFREMAETIAISLAVSPFMPPQRLVDQVNRARDSVLAGRMTPQEAARMAQEKAVESLQRSLREKSAKVQQEYQRRLALQKQIDERIAAFKEIEDRQAAGEAIPEALQAQARPLPEAWIYNPFYKVYYGWKGWLEREQPASQPASAPARRPAK